MLEVGCVCMEMKEGGRVVVYRMGGRMCVRACVRVCKRGMSAMWMDE